MTKEETVEELQYNVVKSNALIQKTRYDLSMTEQKIILRLIQMIEPTDDCFKLYKFKIQDFCEILGIDSQNGGNYDNIKKILMGIHHKCFEITLPDGGDASAQWLTKVRMNRKNGVVEVRLDEDLMPYLLNLKEFFTSYSLYYIITMKSKYSIRLYELMRSYLNLKKVDFLLEDLERKLYCIYEDNETKETIVNYKRWIDFKRFVIDVAVKEINELSDINVSYKTILDGRRVTGIAFRMSLKKDIAERAKAWNNIEKRLSAKKIKKLMKESEEKNEL